MLLSILICHLTNRKALLERLMKCLMPQVDKANARSSFSPLPGRAVQILVESDSGELSTGAKRNKLLDRCKSTWCAAIDDDDTVPNNYVDLILKALEKNPDCVSLNGLMYCEGRLPRKFYHSIKNGPEWREEKDGLRRYLRSPNHINTIRTDLAREVGFMNQTIGEDHCFSKRIFPLLKTEVDIEEVLYHYWVSAHK